jgi:small subunit ribosomal protein S20
MKSSARERERNRRERSRLRAAIRDLRAMTDKDEAAKKLTEVNSLLDRAAATHLVHPRNADRNKSRLAKRVQKLAQ